MKPSHDTLTAGLLILAAGITAAPSAGAVLHHVLAAGVGWSFEVGWQRGALAVMTMWLQQAIWIGGTLAAAGRGQLSRALTSLRLRRPSFSAIWTGVRWGTLLLFVNAFAARVAVALWSRLLSEQEITRRLEREQQALLSLFHAEQPGWLLGALFITVAVLAPLSEELLFRGLLHQVLRKRLGRPALWVSSVLFAAVHFYVIHFIPLFAVGVLLAWLYDRYQNLAVPIVAHGVVNGLVAIIHMAQRGGMIN